MTSVVARSAISDRGINTRRLQKICTQDESFPEEEVRFNCKVYIM